MPEAQGNDQSKEAAQVSLRLRWVKWAVLAVSLTLVGLVLLPVVRRYPESAHAYFAAADGGQRFLFTLGLSVCFVSLLFAVLSPRPAHLRVLRRHPPVWLALLLAALLVCAVDLAIGLGTPTFQPSVWDWLAYGGGSLLVVGGYHCLVERLTPKPPPDRPPVVRSVAELIRDWNVLGTWLRSESPADEDLIGNRRVAERLAYYLVHDGGTVGLVGQFGSGKTTIVKWIKQHAESIWNTDRNTRVLICQFSCWGFKDSASAVQEVLAEVIKEVGQHADCFAIRNLPESYRKVFSAGGDWVRNVADLVLVPTEVDTQFKALNDILTAADARLVVVVEDLDRTQGTYFDRQNIVAFLHRLKQHDRLSFILTSGDQQDFAKLCDRIELVREFDEATIADIVQVVRNKCLSLAPDIQPEPDQENPWHSSGLSEYRDILPRSTALARLLRTPRALKQALRHTNQAWDRLHGEGDFDHLLAVNVLRAGAPEAFDFLLREVNRLQDDRHPGVAADSVEHKALAKRLAEAWEKTVEGVGWNVRAAVEILTFLLPQAGELLGPRRSGRPHRLQGINFPRYWRRIINEGLAPDEIIDQEVLRDMEDWLRQRNPGSPLVSKLVGGGEYAGRWEHFAQNLPTWDGRAVLPLADQVLRNFRTPHGARASNDQPNDAFVALWRTAVRRVGPDDAPRRWIEDQVSQAIPVSLSLVLDLYHYWASYRKWGAILSADREDIRRLIHKLAQEQFTSWQALERALHPEIRYDLYQLVFPPDHNVGGSPCRGVDHWRWLAPPLLHGLKNNPGLFALKVARLIATESHDGEMWTVYRTDRSLLAGLFGNSADEVVSLLRTASDRSTGKDRDLLEQLIRSAEEPGSSTPS